MGKDAEIDPAKAKPDVGSVAGFPSTGTAAAVTTFLQARYKALSGVTGTTPADLRNSANTLLAAQAKTPAYFAANYKVSVLDAGAATTRLGSVNGLNPLQLTGMKDYTDAELTALELALETP